MAKRKAARRTTKTAKHPIHHRIARHADKPVNSLLGYTIILLFLVVTLAVLASYM